MKACRSVKGDLKRSSKLSLVTFDYNWMEVMVRVRVRSGSGLGLR
jgi:hypothetical protein